MSILGVTLVLLLLGIIGWLVLNATKLGDYFKESVEVRAELRGDLNPTDSAAQIAGIAAKVLPVLAEIYLVYLFPQLS